MADLTSGPFNQYVAITPSDTLDILPESRPLYGLFVGGAGNVVVVKRDGSTVTFNTPAVGFVLPVIYKRVNATNTTATGLVGLYES